MTADIQQDTTGPTGTPIFSVSPERLLDALNALVDEWDQYWFVLISESLRRDITEPQMAALIALRAHALEQSRMFLQDRDTIRALEPALRSTLRQTL